MRNLLDESSVAQSLDGNRLQGSLRIPMLELYGCTNACASLIGPPDCWRYKRMTAKEHASHSPHAHGVTKANFILLLAIPGMRLSLIHIGLESLR